MVNNYSSTLKNIEKEYEKKKYKKNSPETLKSLLEEEFPEPEFVVDGLIPEGFTILSGLPKTGKSFLALHIGLAVASGGVALGYFGCKQRNVFYLALEENKRRLQMRVKELLRGKEEPENFYYVISWERFPEGLEPLREFIKEKNIGFLIIDTLARIVNTNGRKGNNAYFQEYTMVEPLSDLCVQEGVSILAIHHRRKTESEDWTLDISGSTGITAVADNLAHLKRARGEKKAELRIRGRDLANDIEMALEWDDEIGFYRYVGDLDAVIESEHSKEILRYLKGVEEAKFSDIVGVLGLQKQQVLTYLTRLEAKGLIKRENRGFYRITDKGKETIW
jgi:RecA-family ATPase